MLITKNQIITLNAHWSRDKIGVCPLTFKRKVYERASNWVGEPLILELTGPRRTGKSVLMEQLRDDAVRKLSITPKHHLHFSFDRDDGASLSSAEQLEGLLEYYFSQVLSSSPAEVDTPVLITLDELQNVKNWSAVVKRYFDLNKNIRFIITGSASLFLQEGGESLAGRAIDFRVECLDFEEFLGLMGVVGEPFPCSVEDLLSMPPQIVTAERKKLFESFLLVGGFPQAVSLLKNGKAVEEIQDYIVRSVINRVLNFDLRRYFNLRHSEKDFRLFQVLCNETGSQISIANLSKESGISEVTLAKRLEVYQKAYLVSSLFCFDTKPRRRIKAHPKLYLASPSIVLSALGYNELPKGSLVGHLVETYVFHRLRQMCKELYFARTSSDGEVDFYAVREKLLLESKYGEFISQNEQDKLVTAATSLNLCPLMITCDSWGSGVVGEERVRMIPASFL